LIRSSNPATTSKATIFIAVALTIAMLYFGRVIFIPLALALVFSFLLTPFVSLLERCHLGRVPATLTVLTLCFALAAGVGWEVAGQLLEITGHIRDYKANLEETIRTLHPPKSGALGQATATVRELNNELASAPAQIAGHSPNESKGTAHPSQPIPVQVAAPPSNLIQEMRTLVGPVAGPLETAGIVVIFTAFMLINREDLRNRLIRLGGQGRLTVMTQALDDASHRLSRYLLLQFLVNVGYGSLFGLGLYLMAVPHALLWGVLAALLRLVPYVGTLIATAFPVAMALAVFPGWEHAALILALFVILELLIANLLEPWLYGAHTGISALAILIAAVFWSMLWGPIGLILSTPLTVCLMLVGRYVPQLTFLEILLGDAPVLGPEELFYQRLLAMDQDEARSIAEEQLREKSLENLYETVLIPALRLAEEDRHTEAVGERTSEFIAHFSIFLF
jgi:predicted PurR-regulated permease PerM